MATEKTEGIEFLDTLFKQVASKNEQSHAPLVNSQTLSLRGYLVLLVAGTLLPVLLFAIFIVYRLSSQDQVASERRTLLAARNLASTVESELSSTVRTLQALAASPKLEQQDLKTFYREAQRVAETQPSWVTVILLSPEGRQLVNTSQLYGKPLPQAGEPSSLWVVKTRHPIVGNLNPSILKPNLLGVPVQVPVMQDQKLRYILTAVINQKTISQVVQEQTSIDGEWTRTIVDGKGIVVSRTRDPERFVGRSGTPSFLKRIRESQEGVYRDTTLEGVKVYVAFCRIGETPWTAAVTVPVDVIQGPSRQVMGLVIGSGLALLLVSGMGAFILSRQISRSITLAALAAEALAKGETPQVSSLSIKEIVLLGQSLEFAADLLAQQERERTENLRRVEAAREEAEAANRIKDEFLAVLSHELRTPLNPILGWSKLLRNGGLDAEKTAFALETIERNAKLQTQLIEDLLDVARIMQGKLNLNMVAVNLAATITATIETMRLAADAKSIQIQTTLKPITGQIKGDSARLQQVIWNLLSNAIKFTPEGGRVWVRLEQVNPGAGADESVSASSAATSCAKITVSDTGKGIDLAFLPHVFEYFRQEDGKTTRRFGGLGLGLAIVRHLVELHGGTVQADSPGEGQGATFTVRLPLLQTADPELEDPSGNSGSLIPHNSPLQGVQVLLVDDDDDARDFTAFLLQQWQMSVTAVASAEAALAVLEETSFDVLISDLGMPRIDGYQLIRTIRQKSPQQGGQIPAIALTAYAGESDQQQAFQAGFHKHLAKPVEPNSLIRAISNVTRTG